MIGEEVPHRSELELKEALGELGVNLDTIQRDGWTFNHKTGYVTVQERVLDEEGGPIISRETANFLTRKRKIKLPKARARALALELGLEKPNE